MKYDYLLNVPTVSKMVLEYVFNTLEGNTLQEIQNLLPKTSLKLT